MAEGYHGGCGCEMGCSHCQVDSGRPAAPTRPTIEAYEATNIDELLSAKLYQGDDSYGSF